MNDVILTPRIVGDIAGKFLIPSYQRGYRWGKEEVTQLLNDIWENGAKEYCLQPIVVKTLGYDTYELIDGQQRLTTLYILLSFIKNNGYKPRISIDISLSYQTRDKSEEYLQNIQEEKAETNIDFFHIYEAYKAIKRWFEDQKNDDLAADKIYVYLCENVKVIWYEIGTSEVDETELFTRLNVGKIPLTNAELVKALFLSQDNGVDDQKQIEISTAWDTIEKELHNEEFWAFITNMQPKEYPTRIELIFDMMANKPPRKSNGQDQYYTFFHFQKEMLRTTREELWSDIQGYYMLLKEWFDDIDSYHKIGYLVAIGKQLTEIIAESKCKRKTEFMSGLSVIIKTYLSLTRDNLLELSYENAKDKMQNILLLFNVETTRLRKNKQEKFSFSNYKRQGWSLEHIHAQNSQISSKREDWREWLSMHEKALKEIRTSRADKDNSDIDMLLSEISIHNNENLARPKFEELYQKTIVLLSDNSTETRGYPHSLSNMALLSFQDNAALNNSAFDVKRNKILEIDKRGGFIPPCTRNVFLKYYTDSQLHTLHFWGEADREAYRDEMIGENGLLKDYLL